MLRQVPTTNGVIIKSTRVIYLRFPFHADQYDAQAQEARDQTNDSHFISTVPSDVRIVFLGNKNIIK